MFESFVELGLKHILDVAALDHVLFIFILTLPFSIQSWKKIVMLATAFTVGHSLTLALVSLEIFTVNSHLVEIGIAVSILITAIGNYIAPLANTVRPLNYIVTLIFGLVHGMGFSSHFKTLLGNNSIIKPLFAFNIGVELAQLIIVICTLTITYIFVDKFELISQKVFVKVMSLIIGAWSILMIVERF